MWDLPEPGLEPVSPALAGRFLTTAPLGKPLKGLLAIQLEVMMCWDSCPACGSLVLHSLGPQPATHSVTALHGFLSCLIWVFIHRHSLREVFRLEAAPLPPSPCRVLSITLLFGFLRGTWALTELFMGGCTVCLSSSRRAPRHVDTSISSTENRAGHLVGAQ